MDINNKYKLLSLLSSKEKFTELNDTDVTYLNYYNEAASKVNENVSDALYKMQRLVLEYYFRVGKENEMSMSELIFEMQKLFKGLTYDEQVIVDNFGCAYAKKMSMHFQANENLSQKNIDIASLRMQGLLKEYFSRVGRENEMSMSEMVFEIQNVFKDLTPEEQKAVDELESTYIEEVIDGFLDERYQDKKIKNRKGKD